MIDLNQMCHRQYNVSFKWEEQKKNKHETRISFKLTNEQKNKREKGEQFQIK